MSEQDFEPSQFRRRSSDGSGGGGGGPTNQELLNAINAVRAAVEGMQDAFLDNDIGKKDYDGHRRDHALRKKANETFEGMKVAAAVKMAATIGGVIGIALLSGAGEQLKQFLGM